MRLLLAVVLLFAAVYAVPASDKCSVTEWGPWSKCKTGLTKIDGSSRPITDSERSSHRGRDAMKMTMRLKEEAHDKRVDCKLRHTCPELETMTTEGPAPCVDGFAGNFPWPCRNVDLLYHVDLADLGYNGDVVEGNDMWVWHDDTEEYVVMGTSHGTSFVRVTDPTAPEVLAILRTHTVPSLWRDMKVVNNHAYIVSEAPGHGMQVFDLTRLRTMAGSDGIQEVDADNHYAEFGQAHNIAANVELARLYVIGSTAGDQTGVCAGGWHVVDVSDSMNPVGLGCADQDGYVHDTECIVYDGPDTRYTGQDICFGYNEDSLTIFDMTEPAAPLEISRTTYEEFAYTHQGWLNPSRRWLLLDDELDEMEYPNNYTRTRVFEVSDLMEPVLTHVFESSEEACDHNQYITSDNMVYQANYEAGLRVLQLEEETGMVEEVAYFDVHPTSTTPNFNGAWSTYPWLSGNTVAVSSFEYGLFLVSLNIQAVKTEQSSGLVYGEQHRFRQTVYGTDFSACPHIVERRLCQP